MMTMIVLGHRIHTHTHRHTLSPITIPKYSFYSSAKAIYAMHRSKTKTLQKWVAAEQKKKNQNLFDFFFYLILYEHRVGSAPTGRLLYEGMQHGMHVACGKNGNR